MKCTTTKGFKLLNAPKFYQINDMYSRAVVYQKRENTIALIFNKYNLLVFAAADILLQMHICQSSLIKTKSYLYNSYNKAGAGNAKIYAAGLLFK